MKGWSLPEKWDRQYSGLLQGLLGARTTSNILPTFAAAGFAGATSTIALHPLEVLRSRLTCDTTGQYKGLISATRQIVKAEGVGSLYRGLGPSFLAILPEAAVTYGEHHHSADSMHSPQTYERASPLQLHKSSVTHVQDLSWS